MWSLRLVQLKLILLLVWSFSEYTDATRLQMFTLYNDTGQSENYTTNVHDLEKVSNLVKSEELTSVCSQVGVWAFFSNKDFADKDAYGYHPATPEWSCNQRRIGADHGFAAVNSIRHLGSGDLDISALSLYKEPYFASDELYFDGDIISLPITHKFYSFGFTGNESWTLYINTNFTGDMVCLRPNLSEESGVTYRTEQLLIVGSIVKGCLRTPRLLPIGEVYRQNDSQNQIEGPDISNLISQKSPSHCLELQDAFYTSPLLVSGNELRLPEPEPFDSFTLQKNSSWTIFKGMEFDGESMCLKNNDSDLNSTTEAENYRFVSSPFLVGSVRQGCEEINKTEGSKTYFNSNSTNPPDNLNNTMSTSMENPLNGSVSTFSPNNLLGNSTEFSNTENPEEITDMVTSSTDTIETETTEPTTGEGTSISNRLGSSTRRGKQLFDDRTTTSIYDNETDIMTTMNPKSELSSNSSRTAPGLESKTNSNGTTTSVSTTNSSVTLTPESTNSNGTTTSVSTTNSSVTSAPESTTNSSGTTTPESMTNSSGTTTPESMTNSSGTTTSESMTNSSGTTTSASKTNSSGTTTLESTTNFSGTTTPESTTNSSGTTTSMPKSNSSSAPTTTSGPLISDVESNITSVKANSTKSENLTNSNSTGTKPEELISNAGSGGLFFTAFIIVLGLLILCMLITLGLFVYFRATRHRDTEELAG